MDRLQQHSHTSINKMITVESVSIPQKRKICPQGAVPLAATSALRKRSDTEGDGTESGGRKDCAPVVRLPLGMDNVDRSHDRGLAPDVVAGEKSRTAEYRISDERSKQKRAPHRHCRNPVLDNRSVLQPREEFGSRSTTNSDEAVRTKYLQHSGAYPGTPSRQQVSSKFPCSPALKTIAPREGGKAQFDEFAGEDVVVKGKVSGTTILVTGV